MAHPATLRSIILAAAVCVAWPALAGAQARERIAYVSLTSRDAGTAATDLASSDIVIREDRVQREVLSVTPATGPMPIAVLVDNSAAAEPAIAELRGALAAFVRALGDLGPVALVTMAERPTVVTAYTASRDALLADVGRIFSRPDSGATVLEAVSESSNGLLKREGERAAIVLVSLGGVEHSSQHATRVVQELVQSGASLHVVALSSPGRGSLDDASRQRDTLFARGTRETGGVRRDILSSMALESALLEVARVLTHQFRVVYARPQTLIPPESFEVAATKPGFIAHGTAARGQPK